MADLSTQIKHLNGIPTDLHLQLEERDGQGERAVLAVQDPKRHVVHNISSRLNESFVEKSTWEKTPRYNRIVLPMSKREPTSNYKPVFNSSIESTKPGINRMRFKVFKVDWGTYPSTGSDLLSQDIQIEDHLLILCSRHSVGCER
jgi:hypothetical protein